MKKVHRLILSCTLVSLALSSACALNRRADSEVSDLLEKYERTRMRETRGYGQLPNQSSVDSSSRGPQPGQTPTDDRSLAGLIAIALERNPDILAAIDVARGMASRVPQATALPDPFLSTKTLPEPVRTAEGDNYFVLGVKQKLPVPEKLDRRGRVALESARMAMEQLEQTRLRVIGDVKRAYFQLYALDNTISITEENLVLLRDLIEVTRGQLVAGRGQQEDVLRSQVELSNLESKLVELRQRRITTASFLNALLDRPHTIRVPTPPEYDVRRVALQVDQLLRFAAQTNPELKRLKRQIARDEHGVGLAKLAYWPDFTIGFEWMQMDPRAAFRPPVNPQTGMRPRTPQMSEDGSDNWAITFGFNIPLWFEKIEAGIREARHKLSASRHQLTSVRNLVTFKVQDALARVRSFREIANLFATTIIPQAEQAYEVSRAGYVAGTSDFQFVIDNWQKWLLFRIQYYRTLAELERSVADLEQVVGISLVNAQDQARSPASEPERSVPPIED
ncbi:MAG: TolC family protein [Planctomycetota bacterium]|nr:TolC family protein [Planctomycetota bacterium]